MRIYQRLPDRGNLAIGKSNHFCPEGTRAFSSWDPLRVGQPAPYVVTDSWPSHLTVPDSVPPIRALQLLEHVA